MAFRESDAKARARAQSDTCCSKTCRSDERSRETDKARDIEYSNGDDSVFRDENNERSVNYDFNFHR